MPEIVIFKKKTTFKNSWVVQWLGLGTSPIAQLKVLKQNNQKKPPSESG